jgi:hypothetical protein
VGDDFSSFETASSVLRSRRAIEINIQIMRAFVRLRQLLSVHKELAERLANGELCLFALNRTCPVFLVNEPPIC